MTNVTPTPTLDVYLRRWGVAVEGDTPRDKVSDMFVQNALGPGGWDDSEVDILVVENQGVWLWGRRPDGTFVERDSTDGSPWLLLDENEEQFWLHHAAHEQLWSYDCFRNGQLSTAAGTLVRQHTEALPVDAWQWLGGDCDLRTHGSCVALILGATDPWVIVSGSSEEALSWVDALNLEWEMDSRTEEH